MAIRKHGQGEVLPEEPDQPDQQKAPEESQTTSEQEFVALAEENEQADR